MIKFKNNDIAATANKITSNSDLFSDELESVTFQLSQLSATVNNYYGGSVDVTAIPDNYRHSWSF